MDPNDDYVSVQSGVFSVFIGCLLSLPPNPGNDEKRTKAAHDLRFVRMKGCSCVVDMFILLGLGSGTAAARPSPLRKTCLGWCRGAICQGKFVSTDLVWCLEYLTCASQHTYALHKGQQGAFLLTKITPFGMHSLITCVPGCRQHVFTLPEPHARIGTI